VSRRLQLLRQADQVSLSPVGFGFCVSERLGQLLQSAKIRRIREARPERIELLEAEQLVDEPGQRGFLLTLAVLV